MTLDDGLLARALHLALCRTLKRHAPEARRAERHRILTELKQVIEETPLGDSPEVERAERAVLTAVVDAGLTGGVAGPA